MIAAWGNRFRLGEAVCFDPATAIIAAVGAAVSAAGSISAGMNQASMARYDQQVSDNNALQAQQAADQQSQVSEQQTSTKLAQQKVDYAASGVDVGQGTPLDVYSDTATKGRLDALTLRYGGQIQAQRDASAGTLAQFQGAAAETAGFAQGAGTLLTSAGKLSQAYGTGSGGGGTAPSAASGPTIGAGWAGATW